MVQYMVHYILVVHYIVHYIVDYLVPSLKLSSAAGASSAASSVASISLSGLPRGRESSNAWPVCRKQSATHCNSTETGALTLNVACGE